jgi:hypothetical protein
MKNDEILIELLGKQLKNVPIDKKFKYSDLKRLCKYIKSSIFDESNCSLWSGYVTNSNKNDKGLYINFYFKGKKAALHRLIYLNFVDELTDNEYLKFTCPNKGKCCNIYHLKKFNYIPKSIKDLTQKTQNVEKNVDKKIIEFKLTFD